MMNRKAYSRRKMIEVLVEEDSYFLDEGWAVLVEEFGKDYGTYFSILSAIARGKTSRSEIMNEIAGDVGGYLTRLEDQYGLIAKNQPIFEPTANKGCRYRLNDNFFRFWFRFVFKHQYLIQVGMFDELRSLVARDYEVFSGLALGGCFGRGLRRSMPIRRWAAGGIAGARTKSTSSVKTSSRRRLISSR